MNSVGNRQFPPEWRIYLEQLPGLWAGRAVPAYSVHNIEPGDLKGWSNEELTILVDEGRQQLGRQSRDLEQVRNRATFLLTTGLGLLALVLAAVSDITVINNPAPFVVWSLGGLAVLLGVLGAAAVVVANKELGMIDTALLSRQESPIYSGLATAYARAVRAGENTVATQITVYRDAVLLVLVGAVMSGGGWLLAILLR
jgi:hypothetical protein